MWDYKGIRLNALVHVGIHRNREYVGIRRHTPAYVGARGNGKNANALESKIQSWNHPGTLGNCQAINRYAWVYSGVCENNCAKM